jgi:hypothetical protein
VTNAQGRTVIEKAEGPKMLCVAEVNEVTTLISVTPGLEGEI